MKKYLISHDSGMTAIISETELERLNEIHKGVVPFAVLGEYKDGTVSSSNDKIKGGGLSEAFKVKLKETIDKLSDEQRAEMKKSWKDGIPKGWVSIDDHLPRMLGKDIFQGFTFYRVKFNTGEERKSGVADHNTWYYMAKERGVTHWFND